jgi:hypothetical protein
MNSIQRSVDLTSHMSHDMYPSLSQIQGNLDYVTHLSFNFEISIQINPETPSEHLMTVCDAYVFRLFAWELIGNYMSYSPMNMC